MKLSDGEKLILLMLCDLHPDLKRKSGINPEIVKSAIVGGHLWALELEYSGTLLPKQEIEKRVATEVINILDMWQFIEDGYTKVPPNERQRIAEEAKLFGNPPQFPGFDERDEWEHIGAARFLIDDLGRFSKFKGRDLNSHRATLKRHLQMLATFEPMRARIPEVGFGVDEIVAVLTAGLHADHP